MNRYILSLCLISFVSLLSINIPPNQFYLAGFLSLAIPVFLLILLIISVHLIFKKTYWFLLPVYIIGINYSTLTGFTGLFKSNNAHTTERILKLVTYNVSGFSGSSQPNHLVDITQWLVQSKADIICLQEATDDSSLTASLPSHNFYFSGKTNPDSTKLGVMILSRFPIVRSGFLEFAFNSFNRSTWTDLIVQGDTIRIINAHLKSYNFQNFKGWQKVKSMKQAMEARSYHAGLLTKFIEQTPYPVILCGDFNETSYSFVNQKFKKVLYDSFEFSGKIAQPTYYVSLIPLRIDHVYSDNSFTVLDYSSNYNCTWSDHYPIEAVFGF